MSGTKVEISSVVAETRAPNAQVAVGRRRASRVPIKATIAPCTKSTSLSGIIALPPRCSRSAAFGDNAPRCARGQPECGRGSIDNLQTTTRASGPTFTTLLQCMSPFVAHLGRAGCLPSCPLLEVLLPRQLYRLGEAVY